MGDGLPPGSKQGGQLRGSDSHPGATLGCSSPVFICAGITPLTVQVFLREWAIIILEQPVALSMCHPLS